MFNSTLFEVKSTLLQHKDKIAFIVFVINFLLLVLYLFWGYRFEFHSDSAVKVLLANEIFESGVFFPEGWYYVNSDLWILFNHVLIIPMLFLFEPGYLVHAISGLISSVLLLWSVWLVIGLFEISKFRKYIILAIFASGFSQIGLEHLYGQAAYGVIFAISLFIFYFSYVFIHKIINEDKIFILHYLILLFLLMLVTWSNPLRSMIYYILPLVASISLLLYKHKLNGLLGYRFKNIIIIYSVVFVPFILGVILHYLSLSKTNNVAGVASATVLSFDGFINNILYFLQGFLINFGAVFDVGRSVSSAKGMVSIISVLAGLSIIVLLIFFYRGLKSKLFEVPVSRIYFYYFSLSSFLIVIPLYLLTSLPNMVDPVGSFRYVFPALLLLLILFLSLKPFLISKVSDFFVVFVVIILMLSSLKTIIFNGGFERLKTNPEKYELISFLKNSDLNYGYATFWNANVNTVLSSNNIKIRPILLSDPISPFRWLSSSSWYRSDVHVGTTFILLTEQEFSKFDPKSLGSCLGLKINDLSFSNYRVLVFSENISMCLNGFDGTYSTLTPVPLSNDSLRHVGVFDRGGIYVEKDSVGAAHFGPYWAFDKGRYRVFFDLVINVPFNEDLYKNFVRVDVATSPSQEMLVNEFISDSGLYSFEFDVIKSSTLEFRVWALGGAAFSVNSISVEKITED